MRRALVVCAVVACVAGLVGAQVPSTGPASSMAAATVPAASPLRTMVDGITLAVTPGKEKEVLELYHFTNPEERKEVEKAMEYSMGYYRLLEAMQKAFPEAKVPRPQNMAALMEKEFEKMAVVKEDGDAATLTMGRDSTAKFVREDGRWKIDYAGSSGLVGQGTVRQQNTEQAERLLKLWQEMTADVEAKKFVTYEEAQAEVRKRQRALGPIHPLERSRMMAARAILDALNRAVKAFEVDNGRFPSPEEGLAVLVLDKAHAPGALKASWGGPYVESVPLDPWGRAYMYKSPGAGTPEKFDLFSSGPDGKEGTEDDIR